MKGLVIREPWIGMIIAGKKFWEMRSKATSIRGEIGLIRAGSGLVCGVAELVDCMSALTPERMLETVDCHAIPIDQQPGAIANGWTVPWVLRNVRRVEPPVPYVHPFGAVTWVNLSEDVWQKLCSTCGEKSTKPVVAPPEIGVPERPRNTQALPTFSANGEVHITLTEGNLRNGHFYLRSAERLLPSAAIGGSNKEQIAKVTVHLRFHPGGQVDTDIAGDKMIFRARSAVRDFFERSGAKAGDLVVLRRVGERDFEVTLKTAASKAGGPR